jgi:hypothetical protein
MSDQPKRKSIDLDQEIVIELSPELASVLDALAPALKRWQDQFVELAAKYDLSAAADAIQAGTSAVDAALAAAVPITPADRKERWDFLRKFSTDANGLGLSEEQFWGLDFGEWLALYRRWEASRDSAILARRRAKFQGKAGRPSEDRTSKIHAKWVEMGRPTTRALICDKIAKDFFGNELRQAKPGSQKHRRVRERVRQAIQRCERRSAT